MVEHIRSKRSRSSGGRRHERASIFARALSYSVLVHGVLFTTAVLVGDLDLERTMGASKETTEVAMAPRTSDRTVSIPREFTAVIEVPPILELVDVVEELPAFDPTEPPMEEQIDPLLEEDPFDELELDPIQKLDGTPEEPVGEEPESVRQVLEGPLPDYPRVAVLRRLEGTVVVRMIVDLSGQVLEVEVVSSSGHGFLDRAALKAARRYRFEAGEGTLTVSKTFVFQL